ncbi:DNA cytosine methyltransferase [Rhizobium sp. Leaf306]|uniref:DNA cytosine methyltransferase n=1 Tax=Rhizobium sp. Leaf306 TaxID=1736330 RepID=UPI00138F22D8|nr:DNA cytosine methyltransferase [Rhizobium sp. Leaf306]
MSVAEELNQNLTPQERLKRGLEHLARMRVAMTAQIFTVLDEVNQLKHQVELDVDTMLRDGGFTDTEINTYINFAPTEDQKKIIRANKVSFEAVAGLPGAEGEARREVMRSIERDPSFSYEQIQGTFERRRGDTLSIHDKLFVASQRAFAETFSQANMRHEASFRYKASTLHALMGEFSRLHAYVDRNPFRRTKMLTSARYAPFLTKMKGVEDQLALAAEELFTELNSVFPGCSRPMKDWAFIALEKPAEAYLAQAHYSLQRMSRREFHMDLPGEHTSYYSWSSFDAIRFLSGIKREEDQRKAPQVHPRDLRKLNAIDICAGSGGQALGLEAAGFNIRALVDFDRTSLETLSRNRKRWNVIECDLSEPLTQDAIHGWRGDGKSAYSLDLVSGSLPTAPWDYRGDGIGELFTATKQIIASLQPKAFFFETDEGFKADRHREFRLSLRQYFANLGYRTKIWKLSADEFGVPQNRTRYYFVGLKRGQGYGDLLPPEWNIKNPIGRTIWSAAFPDLSEHIRHILKKNFGESVSKIDLKKAKEGLNPVQQAYDRWALNWLRDNKKCVPDLGKIHLPIVGAAARAWGEAGFAPQLRRPVSISDPYFALVSDREALAKSPIRPRTPKVALTASVLRLLQGIPADWELEGDEASQIQQLSGMRPPLMSLAVARQIHKAITGQSVDHSDPEARKITSGRDRKLPSFVNNSATHPDPMRYRAQMWKNSKIDEENQDRNLAFDDDDFDD